jgi:hypothetical protein
MMYDIIGDIHGHADELKALLERLDYIKVDGIYRHLERTPIFLGDFIDRGPKIRETLQVVRPMIDSGTALAVMGNHEFNFLCYNREVVKDKFLREHNDDNDKQVKSTVEAFEGKKDELENYLQWFYTLPLFLELDGFRIVHACWKPDTISQLQNLLLNDRLTPDLLIEAGTKETELYESIEVTLKGPEKDISPDFFYDKEDKRRTKSRVKWWLNPDGLKKSDYYIGSSMDTLLPLDMQQGWYYRKDEKPVFIGHYWKEGELQLESSNVCCVDYSVAKPKKDTPNPRLVAYRWRAGKLEKENLVIEDRH